MTAVMKPSTVFCVLDFPLSSECSAIVLQLHSDNGSVCIQSSYSDFLLRQNLGTAERILERIETYTNGVWFEPFSVKNAMGGTFRPICENNIRVGK